MQEMKTHQLRDGVWHNEPRVGLGHTGRLLPPSPNRAEVAVRADSSAGKGWGGFQATASGPSLNHDSS